MQIANLSLYNTVSQTTPSVTNMVPTFARKDEAAWHSPTLPEIGRRVLAYTRRPPVKGTELVKHSFRVTVPTLRSLVADPSGPYQPTPALDYVTVAEISLWCHPRATAAEREAAYAGAFGLMINAHATDTFRDGNTLF